MNISIYLETEARENLETALKVIPEKVKSVHTAEYICNKWMFGNLERNYQCNSIKNKRPSFPIHIYLKLAKDDDICVEGMLFLEEIEEEKKIEFMDTPYLTDGGLKAYQTFLIYIHFMPHEEGKCRIIKHTREEFVKQEYTRTEIVCL